MKNWKRILAAVGSAALMASNLGAVSQAVFAQEPGIGEDIPDTQEDTVEEAIQDAITQTLDSDDPGTPAAEESNVTDSAKQDQPSTPPPTEGSSGTSTDTAVVNPADGTPTPTDPAAASGQGESSDKSDDENASGGATTEEGEDDINEGTTEDPADDVTEGSTEVPDEVIDEETPEDGAEAEEEQIQVGDTDIEVNDGRILIKAYAADGAIPEGARFQASLIEKENRETEQQYEEVEEILDESDEVAYEKDNDEYDFIAMDVRFETQDEDGAWTEFEPQSPVSVTFDLEPGVLPEGADAETVTVHHLEEDADGSVEDVVTVADTDTNNEETGSVEVRQIDATESDTTPAVAVEFEVESFSTFSICWKAPNKWQEDETIVVHYVDTDGNEIDTETSKDITEEDGTGGFRYLKKDGTGMIDLRFFARDISGYTFDSIKVKGRADADVPNTYSSTDAGIVDAQFMGWIYDSKYASGNSLRYYSFAGINDNDEVQYNELGEFGQAVDVFIVYREGRTQAAEAQNITPTVRGDKKAQSNNNGTYTLTIDAAAKAGDGEEKQKIDILFVLDTSSSMIKNWVNTERSIDRATAAERAILAAVDTLENNKENVDAHYGLVTFSTYAAVGNSLTYVKDDSGTYSFSENSGNYVLNTGTHYSWKLGKGYYEDADGEYVKDDKGKYISTDGNKYHRQYEGYGVHQDLSATPINQSLLDQVSYAGDTNYEAAMIATRQAMEQARPEAKKVVIFLTDGTPTRAYGTNTYKNQNLDDGRIEGTGKESQDVDVKKGFLDRALTELNSSGLHLSGTTKDAFYAVGLGVTTNKKGEDNYELFVKPLADDSHFASGVTSEAFKVDDDADSLVNKFKDIIAKEISIDATNVVIEDPLSEYVTLAGTASESLQVKVTDADGKDVPDADNDAPGYQIRQTVDGKEETFTLSPECKKVTSTETVNGETVTTTHEVIVLDFQDDYTLESGYTYQVVAQIKPTAAAYAKYRELQLYNEANSYPDTEQVDGSATDNKGLYTNGAYTVTREADGEHTEDWTETVNPRITYQYQNTSGANTAGVYEYNDRPVITLDPGSITITKTISGLTEQDRDAAAANTAFEINVKVGDNAIVTRTISLDGKVKGTDSQTGEEIWTAYNSIVVNKTNASGGSSAVVYTVVYDGLKGLDAGATYTVTEVAVKSGNMAGEVAGWQVRSDATSASGQTVNGMTVSGSIAWATTSNASYRNAYTRIVDTGVEDGMMNVLPALVATIDMMAVVTLLYGMVRRRVR